MDTENQENVPSPRTEDEKSTVGTAIESATSTANVLKDCNAGGSAGANAPSGLEASTEEARVEGEAVEFEEAAQRHENEDVEDQDEVQDFNAALIGPSAGADNDIAETASKPSTPEEEDVSQRTKATTKGDINFLDSSKVASSMPDFSCSPGKNHNQINNESTGDKSRNCDRSAQLVLQDVLSINSAVSGDEFKGSWSKDNFCLAVEDNVLIFDSKCTRHLATINVGETICTITYSDNQSFLLIGDNSGVIHFVHIPTATLLYSRSLCHSEDERTPILWISAVYSPFSGHEEVIIITESNRLIRVTNMQFAALETALATEDYGLAKSLYQETQVEEIAIDTYSFSQFQCATYSSMTESVYVAGKKDKSTYPLTVWGRPLSSNQTSLLDYVNMSLDGNYIKKLECHPTQYKMFALTDDNQLSVWDLYSLVLVQSIQSDPVLDFQVMGAISSLTSSQTQQQPHQKHSTTTTENFQLVMITKSLETNITRVEIRDINNASLICGWVVPEGTVLVDSTMYQGGGILLTMANSLNQINMGNGQSEDEDVESSSGHGSNLNERLSGLSKGNEQNGNDGRNAFLARHDENNNLVISHITESIMIQRYYELILNGDYDEAEVYANEFEMDQQVLYKYRLDKIKENPTDSSVLKSYTFEKLSSLIRKMQDLNEVCDFCLNVPFNDMDLVYKLHTLAFDILIEKEKEIDYIDPESKDDAESDMELNERSSEGDNDQPESQPQNQISYEVLKTLKREVQDAKYRFSTFKLLKGISADPMQIKARNDNEPLADADNNDDTSNMHLLGLECVNFRLCNLSRYAMECLAQSDIRGLCILWIRHGSDCISGRTFEGLSDIPVLSTNVKEVKLVLSQHIAPSLTAENDRLFVLSWIKEHTLSLESQFGSNIAYDFISVLFHSSSVGSNDGTPQQRAEISSSSWIDSPTPQLYASSIAHGCNMVRLGDCILGSGSTVFNEQVEMARKLFKALADIVYLKSEHGYEIRLDDYNDTNPTEICMLLMGRVNAPELIEDTIYTHLVPYAERNDLNAERVLVEYCMSLLDGTLVLPNMAKPADTNTGYLNTSKTISILNSLKDENNKTDIVLQLMKTTSIPWSDELNLVFEDASNWTGRRSEEIDSQYTLLVLKKMLLKYRINDFNIANKAFAHTLLPKILSRVEDEEALCDAMLVVKAYHDITTMEVYKVRATFLLDNNLLDATSSLLKQIEDDNHRTLTKLKPSYRLARSESLAISEELYIWKEELLNVVIESVKTIGYTEQLKAEYVSIVKQMICLAACMRDIVIMPAHNFKRNLATENISMEYAYSQFNDTEELLKLLNCMLKLASELNLFYTLEEISTGDKRSDILKNCGLIDSTDLESLTARDVEDSDKKSKGKGKKILPAEHELLDEKKTDGSGMFRRQIQSKLDKIGEILLFRRPQVLQKIAVEAARRGDVGLALSIGKELALDSEEEGLVDCLHDITMLVSTHSSKETFWSSKSNSDVCLTLSDTVRQFGQLVVSQCDDSYLPEAVHSFIWTDLQYSIFEQSNMGSYSVLLEKNQLKSLKVQTDGCTRQPQIKLDLSKLTKGVYDDIWANKILTRCKEDKLGTLYQNTDNNKTDGSNVGSTKLEKSKLFEDSYMPRIFVLEISIVMPLIAKLKNSCELVAYVSAGRTLSSVRHNKQLAYGNVSITEESFESAFEEVVVSCKNLIEYLVRYNSPRTSLQVLYSTLSSLYIYPEVSQEDGNGNTIFQSSTKLYNLSINKLVTDVMASKSIDKSLVIGCLLSLPMKEAFEVFKAGLTTSGFAFSRLISIAKVGIAVATIWKQRAFRVSCEDLEKNAKWWQLLSMLNIPFKKEEFKYNHEAPGCQRNIIPLLLKKTGNDVATCLDFARGYNIEEDYVYLEFIKQVFLDKTEFGNKSDFVLGIIENIANKEKLYNTLASVCLLSISPYDYDRIAFVATLILTVKPQDELGKICKAIVDIIKDYKRICAPTIEELFEAKKLVSLKIKQATQSVSDYELRVSGTVGSSSSSSNTTSDTTPGVPNGLSVDDKHFATEMEKILLMNENELREKSNHRELLLEIFSESLSRLPYHTLVLDPWSILKGEICEATLLRLKPLRRTLGLDPDTFYVLTLRKMMIDDMKDYNGDPLLFSNTADKNVFKVADVSVDEDYSSGMNSASGKACHCKIPFKETRKFISNILNKETAMKTALQLATKYPPGYDRIHSYMFAYNTSRSLLTAKSDFVSAEYVDLLKKKVVFAQIENYLTVANLEEFVKNINLANNGEELLRKLYHDRSEDALSSGILLNETVDEICGVLGREPTEFKKTLISDLLSSAIEFSDCFAVNSEKCLPSTRVQVFSAPERKKHVQLRYLLSSMPSKDAVEMVLEYAGKPQSSIPTMNRIRALRVLFDVAPTEFANNVEGGDDVFTYLHMLMYLGDFEDLQIPQTLREFESCDKRAFVRSLWLQYEDNIKCTQLICNICLDYNIVDSSIWDMALKKLAMGGSFFYILGLFSSLIESEVLVTVGQFTYLPTLWANTVVKVLQMCMDHLDSRYVKDANISGKRILEGEETEVAVKKLKTSDGVANFVNATVKITTHGHPVDDLSEISEAIERSISLIIKCPFLSELKIEPVLDLIRSIKSKWGNKIRDPGWNLILGETTIES